VSGDVRTKMGAERTATLALHQDLEIPWCLSRLDSPVSTFSDLACDHWVLNKGVTISVSDVRTPPRMCHQATSPHSTASGAGARSTKVLLMSKY
jgi:hypothetical protein